VSVCIYIYIASRKWRENRFLKFWSGVEILEWFLGLGKKKKLVKIKIQCVKLLMPQLKYLFLSVNYFSITKCKLFLFLSVNFTKCHGTNKTARFWSILIDETFRRWRRNEHDRWRWEKMRHSRMFQRPQDYLMPGLRHAHTLQQLKMVFEYSPPGEYLKQQLETRR